MSLFYSDTEAKMKGKTTDKEDRFTARSLELEPNKRILVAIRFESPDPAYADEMIMEVNLEPFEGGTRVTISFKNIPSAIKPEDNEAGTISSLEKLANLEQSVIVDR